LLGLADGTISIKQLSSNYSIEKLTGHSNRVSSLLLLNDKTFASASLGEIKIWSIHYLDEYYSSIECIKTINAHENSNFGLF
jgi:WD40 repeat protein